jgi:hypothetical protein
MVRIGSWEEEGSALESGILIMQFPTSPFDTDRAIRLPGRVNGADVG